MIAVSDVGSLRQRDDKNRRFESPHLGRENKKYDSMNGEPWMTA